MQALVIAELQQALNEHDLNDWKACGHEWLNTTLEADYWIQDSHEATSAKVERIPEGWIAHTLYGDGKGMELPESYHPTPAAALRNALDLYPPPHWTLPGNSRRSKAEREAAIDEAAKTP